MLPSSFGRIGVRGLLVMAPLLATAPGLTRAQSVDLHDRWDIQPQFEICFQPIPAAFLTTSLAAVDTNADCQCAGTPYPVLDPHPPVPLPPNPEYALNPPLNLSAGDKAVFYYHRLMNPGTALGPAAEAAVVMAWPPNAYPNDWRQGAAAFGRNYGAVLGRVQTAEFSRFAVGLALREDPRYYPSPNRNLAARVIHSLRFTLADRSDSGHSRPAFANFIGATAGGFVGDAYLPTNYTDLRHATARTGFQMATFAFRNIADEFAPELDKLTHALQVRLHPGS
jgi:hypothetical protein